MIDRYYPYNTTTKNLVNTNVVNWITHSGSDDFIVATDKGLVITPVSANDVWGWQDFEGGFKKAIYVPDNYVWALSTISGVCVTTISGVEKDKSLVTSSGTILPDAFTVIYPDMDNCVFESTSVMSNNSYLITKGAGKAGLRFDYNFGTLFTVSGTGGSTDRGFLTYDYPLKPPFKIQVKFKLRGLSNLGYGNNSPGPDIIGLRYSNTPLDSSNQGTRIAGIVPVYQKNNGTQCDIGYYYRDSVGDEVYFYRWDKRWIRRTSNYIYGVDNIVFLTSDRYYLAELVVDANWEIEFVVKNVDGTLLGGNKWVNSGSKYNMWNYTSNSGKISSSYGGFYPFFGDIGPNTRYPYTSHCYIDYAWIKIWREYTCDEPYQITDFDTYYSEGDDRRFLAVSTTSGAIVIGGAGEDYSLHRRWKTDKEYCSMIRLSGGDFYTVVGSGLDAKTVKYYKEFRASRDGYVGANAYFTSNYGLVLNSYVTDLAVISGTAFNGLGNTILAGTADGLVVVEHGRQLAARSFYSYGPEEVILLDSFAGDNVGVHPGCWINESADSEAQYLRVTIDSGREAFTRTNHWRTDAPRCYDKGTLAGIRRYTKYGPHHSVGDYRFVTDDRYAWWPKKFRTESKAQWIENYDPEDYGIPENTIAVVRADKFSSEMSYFDISKYMMATYPNEVKSDKDWDSYSGLPGYWHDSIQIHGLSVTDKYVYFVAEHSYTYGPTYRVGSTTYTAQFNFSIFKLDRETLDVVCVKHYHNDTAQFFASAIIDIWPHEQDGYIYCLAQNPHTYFSGFLFGYNDLETMLVVLDDATLEVVEYVRKAFGDGFYIEANEQHAIYNYYGSNYLWITNPYYKKIARIDMRGKGNWNSSHFKAWSLSEGIAELKIDSTYMYVLPGVATSTKVYIYKHNGDEGNSSPFTNWPKVEFNLYRYYAKTEKDPLWYTDECYFRLDTSCSEVLGSLSQDENSIYIGGDTGGYECYQGGNLPLLRMDKISSTTTFTNLSFKWYRSTDNCKSWSNYGCIGVMCYGYQHGTRFCGDATGYEWLSRYGATGNQKVCNIVNTKTTLGFEARRHFKDIAIQNNYVIKFRFKPYDKDVIFAVRLNKTSAIELKWAFSQSGEYGVLKRKTSGGSFVNLSNYCKFSIGGWSEYKLEVFVSSNTFNLWVDGIQYESGAYFCNMVTSVNEVAWIVPAGRTSAFFDGLVIYDYDILAVDYNVKTDYPSLHGTSSYIHRVTLASNFQSGDTEVLALTYDPVFGGSISQINLCNMSLYAYYDTYSPIGPQSSDITFLGVYDISNQFIFDRPQKILVGGEWGFNVLLKWSYPNVTSMSVRDLSYEYWSKSVAIATKGGAECLNVTTSMPFVLAYAHRLTGYTCVFNTIDGIYLGAMCSGVSYIPRSLFSDTTEIQDVTSSVSILYTYSGGQLPSDHINQIHGKTNGSELVVATENGLAYITTSIDTSQIPTSYLAYRLTLPSAVDTCFLADDGSLWYNIRDIGLAVNYSLPKGWNYFEFIKDFEMYSTTLSGIIIGSGYNTLAASQSFITYNRGLMYKVSVYIKKVGNPPDLEIGILPATIQPYGSRFSISSPAGKPVASGTVSSSAVGNSFNWVDIYFDKYLRVYEDNAYHLVMSCVTGSVSNSNYDYYIWGGSTTSIEKVGDAKFNATSALEANWLIPYYVRPRGTLYSRGFGDLYMRTYIYTSVNTEGIFSSYDYLYTANSTPALPTARINEINVIASKASDGYSSLVFIATNSGVLVLNENRNNPSLGTITWYDIETSSEANYNILKGSTSNMTTVWGFSGEEQWYSGSSDGLEGGAFNGVSFAVRLDELRDFITHNENSGFIHNQSLDSVNINDLEVVYFEPNNIWEVGRW